MRRVCGPEGRQPLGQSLHKFEPTGFGLGPLAGLGALAKVVAVHLPVDPLGTVAPPAGAIFGEFATGGMAGKRRKISSLGLVEAAGVGLGSPDLEQMVRARFGSR